MDIFVPIDIPNLAQISPFWNVLPVIQCYLYVYMYLSNMNSYQIDRFGGLIWIWNKNW